MELTVFGYAKGIDDILSRVKSDERETVLQTLDQGQTKRKINLEVKGTKVILQHSGKVTLMPDTFYNFVSRDFNFMTYKIKLDYIYNGKDRTFEKLAPYDEDITSLLNSVMEIPFSELKNIFLETDHFKIIYSFSGLTESVIFEFKNENTAKNFFRKFLSILFPYIKVGMSVNKVENGVEFKLDSQKKGELNIKVKYDGSPAGTKTAILS